MAFKYRKLKENIKLPNLEDYKFVEIECDSIYDLKFNPYNDRFAMEFNEYKLARGHSLGFDDTSQNFIFNLLLETNSSRNQSTQKDILKNGVLKAIVVDKNGIILDGNRRIAILRNIIKNESKITTNKQQLQFKKPTLILLNEELNEIRIREIETVLQISEDEKVNYDPINMYLKINRLYSERQKLDPDTKKEKIFEEIASLLGPKYDKKFVRSSYDVFQIMEQWLRFFKKNKNYTWLKNKEDHYKQITNFYKSAKKGSINIKNLTGESSEEKLSKIQEVLFNLTAAQVEGKLFRKLVPSPRTLNSPLLSEQGVSAFQNYIASQIKKNGIVEIQKHNNPKIDFAIKNLAERYSKQKSNKNQLAQTEDIFKKIEAWISQLENWKDSLPKYYEKDKNISKKIYSMINKLKKILKEYEEDA